MNRKEIVKEYKNSLRPMGIVQARNLRNDRVYITASANTPGTINSIRFQLRMGTFLPCPALGQDWSNGAGSEGPDSVTALSGPWRCAATPPDRHENRRFTFL